MTRHHKSQDSKQRSKRSDYIQKMHYAVSHFRELEAQGLHPSVRQVARMEDINVNHVTLGRHLKGFQTMDEFNATKTKLSGEQESVLVDWIIELANCNLGLQPSVVRERATQLYQSTHPNGKIGIRWVTRFIGRHGDKLSCHWSRPLDKIRAISATPEVMDNYFNQYKSIVRDNGEKLSPDRQFAYDESGVLRGMGERSRVVSSRNNKAAKVNRGGSRELITFVPIICANGELVTSLAVFPGKLLRREWVENNPGKFATTYSAKGYMTNLLGEAFIKLFHNATAHLEESGPRLLHVDSHSSHVNLALLDFAVQHNIIILGYPPHTTNLTQGLDVVVFSSFKHAYAKRAAEHLMATGREVEKRDFLSILDGAVQDSFTRSNLLSAFHATGLRPPNRSAIRNVDLAPSKAFSSTQILPLPPFPEIQAVVNAIHQHNRHSEPPPTTPLSPQSSLPDSTLPNSHFNYLNPPIQATRAAVPSQSPTPEQVVQCPNQFESSIQALCDDIGALSIDPPSHPQLTNEPNVTILAEDILHSLASTPLAPILQIDTISSACNPPPVESGPLPTQLVELLKRHKGAPSESLWTIVKEEIIRLVPRADRQLATNILQHTYCQQLQRKLAQKETNRKQTSLQKVSGFKNGFIYTSEEVMAILAEDAEFRRAQLTAAEQRRELRELKKEAKKWLDDAKEAQREQHTHLVEEWKALPPSARPTRRQPPKPPLPPMPGRFHDALARNQGRARAPARAQTPDDSDSYAEDSD